MSQIELYAHESPAKEPYGIVDGDIIRKMVIQGIFKPKDDTLLKYCDTQEKLADFLLERGDFVVGNYFEWSKNIGIIKKVVYPQITINSTPEGTILQYIMYLEVQF